MDHNNNPEATLIAGAILWVIFTAILVTLRLLFIDGPINAADISAAVIWVIGPIFGAIVSFGGLY